VSEARLHSGDNEFPVLWEPQQGSSAVPCRARRPARTAWDPQPLILLGMIANKAYRDGIPANGKSVPDGAAMAKIEWSRTTKPVSPYGAAVPGTLNDVSIMVEDAKRFRDTNG
jgi:hypothetical protein